MKAITLATTTNVQSVDEIIYLVVATLEESLPGRVLSYYLTGSYADHSSAGMLSDIDLFVILKGRFTSVEERDRINNLVQQCASISTIRLDTLITCENELPQLHPVLQVAIQLGSLVVYGKDARTSMRMPTIEFYTQAVTDGAFHFIAKVLRNSGNLSLPVNYPNPDGEFYGYDQRRIDSWYPASVQAGTKELVACVSRIATSIIAMQTKKYVASKSESIRLYQLYIGDRWAGFVESLYETLRTKWLYLIPSDRSARVLLRQFCEQALYFENSFLEQYHSYLLGLSQSADDKEHQFAVKRLKRFTGTS